MLFVSQLFYFFFISISLLRMPASAHHLSYVENLLILWHSQANLCVSKQNLCVNIWQNFIFFYYIKRDYTLCYFLSLWFVKNSNDPFLNFSRMPNMTDLFSDIEINCHTKKKLFADRVVFFLPKFVLLCAKCCWTLTKQSEKANGNKYFFYSNATTCITRIFSVTWNLCWSLAKF